MDLPEVVVAQAEAAASANRDADPEMPTQNAPKTEKQQKRHEAKQIPKRAKDAQGNGTETTAANETPIEHVPHVAYGPQLGQVDFSQDGFDTKAKVAGKGISSRIQHEY